jgi:hypothetical protein
MFATLAIILFVCTPYAVALCFAVAYRFTGSKLFACLATILAGPVVGAALWVGFNAIQPGTPADNLTPDQISSVFHEHLEQGAMLGLFAGVYICLQSAFKKLLDRLDETRPVFVLKPDPPDFRRSIFVPPVPRKDYK